VSSKHIVIVGAGFSGAALAMELAASGAAPRVTVIERSHTFGQGLAYSTKEPDHLLNVHAERMSVLAETPLDFVSWLKAKQVADAAHAEYVPRHLFGDYLADRIRITESFAAHGAFELVHAAATSVRTVDGKVRVETSDGRLIEADAAVLALGHLPPGAPFGPSPAQGYTPDPWAPGALSDIPAHADVLLVGAGLTMIDVALTLSRGSSKRRLIALSRRGLTPLVHTEAPPRAPDPMPDLPVQLSDALRELRRRAREAGARGEPWQHVMNDVRAQARDMWRRLPLEAQKRFLRHARPFWDIHRHRAAPNAVGAIEDLKRRGRLTVLAGRILDVASARGKVSVRYRARGRRDAEMISVGAIVNCTGASPDVSRADDPLVRQMLHEGLGRAHPNGLGFDVDPRGALVAKDGAASERLFAIGPPTQGAFWEITAVQEIRDAARELSQVLTN
jgi:uncharacterized NAD(P)/FAD-binding protein YdhS